MFECGVFFNTHFFIKAPWKYFYINEDAESDYKGCPSFDLPDLIAHYSERLPLFSAHFI